MIDRRIQRRAKPRNSPAEHPETLPVSFNLPVGSTQADVIHKIAKRLGWKVKSLPERLKTPSLRGRTVFGLPKQVLDGIARNNDLDWDVEDDVLNLRAMEDRPPSNRECKPRKGGRPRKDDERRSVLELKKEGKSWRQIAAIINRETGQTKTSEAYRKLATS